MEFDFTTKPERSGMDAIAVDFSGKGASEPKRPKEGFSLIPMWVADMNFVTAPCITKALMDRAAHPAYGYFEPRKEYYDSIIRWHTEMHGEEGITREMIGYENGVLGSLCSCLKAFTVPGEPVFLHSPAYIGFTGTLERLGRKGIHSRLYKDQDDIWRMDYADMDKKIKEKHIRFAIFCSPHNPTGRVWTREELGMAMEIFRKNDVVVFSDEIWSDIVLDGNRHIPTQMLSEDAMNRTIALYAPSKTFNLAGLIGSYHVIVSPYLRDRVRQEGALSGYNNMNVMSQHALIGAYSPEGQRWVMELRQVLSENVAFAVPFIRKIFSGVQVCQPQGTYMLFLDLSGYLAESRRSLEEVLAAGWEVGVAWQDGRPFLGTHSIRMNLALPIDYVKEAFWRLNKYVF